MSRTPNSFFNVHVDIERVTETADALGGRTKTWTVLHSRLKGNLQVYRGKESSFLEKETVEATYVFFCDIVDVTEKDRLIYNSRTFRILFVENPIQMNRFLRLDLREILGES